MNNAIDQQAFAEPPVEYRAKPFWAWNAALEEQELRRQIRIFAQMGFGGFFMHSRVGLNTKYLGEEWLRLTKACVDEAQQTQTEAWLYDEDRWPSGSAGGLVTRDPKYRLRTMTIQPHERAGYTWPVDDAADAIYVFAARMDEKQQLLDYRPLADADAVSGVAADEHIIDFIVRATPQISWFNGQTYLDTMSHEAVAKFIEVTHEAYRREAGEHFGKTVPGIFTDEPSHGPAFRAFFDIPAGLPWTPRLAQHFQAMFGYDVLPYLPELAFDRADGRLSKARYHYHRCKTRLFCEAFGKQIGQWCEQNNLIFTGHVLEEDPISANVSVVGAAMQFYPYMQAPGVDILTQYRLEYLAVKQCASVARQCGRKWVLSELYGCTGWETTFETYKHSGDWQAALGITLRCPHLSWYSMAGEAKRDFPASIHFHSPWWRQYRQVEDYFSRLNVALTAGKAICDLAVIHPGETYFLLTRWPPDGKMPEDGSMNDPRLHELDKQYQNLVETLLKAHLDFDFVDEELLTELAGEVGRDSTGAYLQVGKMKYRAVLVPKVLTLRHATVEKLRLFAEAGGKLVFSDQAPDLVDVEPNDAALQLAERRTVAFDSLIATLETAARYINITDAKGREVADVFYQLRQAGDDWVLFLNNTNRQQDHKGIHVQLRAPLKPAGQLQRWDATTGNSYSYPGSICAERARFDVDLASSGSVLFVIRAAKADLPTWPAPQPSGQATTLGKDKWDYALDDRNVFVLDRCDCLAEAEGKEQFRRDKAEIMRVDTEIRNWLEICQRGGDMVQPWAAQDEPLAPKAEMTLTYAINVRSLPTGPVWLALEQPERWSIDLNGWPLSATFTDGWWVDPAIQTIPIDPTTLKRGDNTLTLTGQFDDQADLELVFLLGGFGVQVEGRSATMTDLPPRLRLGDWTEQGLPFYSGNVTYSTSFNVHPETGRRYLLNLPDFAGTAVEVAVNDDKPHLLPWPDYQLDITDQLKAGRNTLAVKVLGSRRNSFGPFHLGLEKPHAIWPGSWRHGADTENINWPNRPWQEDFMLAYYGLLAPPVLMNAT